MMDAERFFGNYSFSIAAGNGRFTVDAPISIDSPPHVFVFFQLLLGSKSHLSSSSTDIPWTAFPPLSVEGTSPLRLVDDF